MAENNVNGEIVPEVKAPEVDTSAKIEIPKEAVTAPAAVAVPVAPVESPAPAADPKGAAAAKKAEDKAAKKAAKDGNAQAQANPFGGQFGQGFPQGGFGQGQRPQGFGQGQRQGQFGQGGQRRGGNQFQGRKLVSKEKLYERLREHIHTVVNRYKDVVYCWDVVNEAIADGGDQPLRNSTFYQICGNDEFIKMAFIYAREADPNALLFYNDYNECNPQKRDRIYEMVKRLKSEGAPIDGIGMQGHYNIYGPSEEEMEAALAKYSEIVDHIQVTELDIRVNEQMGGQLNMDRNEGQVVTQEQKQMQEQQYDRLFRALRRHKDKVDVVTFWNVSDRDSWVGTNNYPLLFDKDLKKIGEITHFAKDEMVKSVSFDGNIGYVVTFVQTDPLFAVDLSDPANPTILDEFKIDGFSTYMQKWDEGHLLGFGKTVTNNREDGYKIVMFDNSDPEDLKEAAQTLETTEADWLISLARLGYPPQRGYVIRDGSVEHMFPQYKRCRTQDLEPVYRFSGSFTMYKTEIYLGRAEGSGKCYPIIVPDEMCQDIDNESDWKNAELKYKVFVQKLEL